jgi:hypothetical protein
MAELDIPVTEQNIAALRAAIATGVRVVQYADRRLEYQTVGDMIKALALFEGILDPTASRPVRYSTRFSKGLSGAEYDNFDR